MASLRKKYQNQVEDKDDDAPVTAVPVGPAKLPEAVEAKPPPELPAESNPAREAELNAPNIRPAARNSPICILIAWKSCSVSSGNRSRMETGKFTANHRVRPRRHLDRGNMLARPLAHRRRGTRPRCQRDGQ
jgi:hypothetical protein